jgi:hypothetical protein
MAKRSDKSQKKCQRYFNERRRIKNKTRKLLKRIKNLKKETQEKILKVSKIGRKKERSRING